VLPILTGPGAQGLAQRVTNRRGQLSDGAVEDFGGVDAGDLAGLIIKYSDMLVDAGGDHPRGQVLQQRLIIDLGILHFGKELRVINGHGQLTAQNLQGVLLHAAVDVARCAGAEEHDARQMFAGKDAHGDGGV
jgi:hypothetical protein